MFHPTGNSSLKDDAGARYVGHASRARAIYRVDGAPGFTTLMST